MTRYTKKQLCEKNEVINIYNTYPKEIRKKLLGIRQLIFDVASSNPNIGELEETIKWGEPSYLTKSKSGSTIRLGFDNSCLTSI